MEKLDSKAVWIFFFQFLGFGLILTLIIGFLFLILIGWLSFVITIPLVIIGILGSYGWSKLYYDNYKFELAEEAFKKEYGVIWKHYVSIPYERIQNVDIHRGILAQILGLSDLMIHTAGYSGVFYGRYGTLRQEPEGKLPGLSRERAEEIREELIKRAKGAKSGL